MITLSMIVKNEEAYLKDCLNSVKDVVDEIVIVDTGSSDNTKTIAKEFGAKVFDFTWIDNFSAARNFALENSSSDWILYLDADERLTESSKDELLNLTKENNNCAYYCRVRSINNLNGKSSVMNYVRLFPNDKSIKFEGKIHEQIENSLRKNNFSILKSNIEILHLGYSISENDLQHKAKRNLKILIDEFNRQPSSYYAFQLGQTYGILNDKINAERYFLNSLKDQNLKNEYSSVANRYLAVNNAERGDWNSAHIYIEESINADPTQPTALIVAAKIYFYLGKREEAKSFCKKAYLMNEEFLSGKRSSHQTILPDRRTILYEGINIAANLKDKDLFKFFYTKSGGTANNLDNEKENRKADFINKLFENLAITESGVDEYIDLLNDESDVNMITGLVENYYDTNLKQLLLEKIYDKFPFNTIIINKLALTLEKNNNPQKAEELLEKSFSLNSEDPAVVFYLISAYVKNKNFDKIAQIIETAEENFINEPIILQKISLLKERLSLFIKEN